MVVEPGSDQNRRLWPDLRFLFRQGSLNVLSSDLISVRQNRYAMVPRDIQQHGSLNDRRHLGDTEVLLAIEIDLLGGGHGLTRPGVQFNLAGGIRIPVFILSFSRLAK